MAAKNTNNKRALGVAEFIKMKKRTVQLHEPWNTHIGNEVEFARTWIIWGNSGNGKTRYALRLAKYLCKFKKVAYNALEEFGSPTLLNAIMGENMLEVNKRFVMIKENKDELIETLSKRKSPDIVFIDSLQYFDLNYRQYIELKEMFPKKLFIFISHADGMQPSGRVAKSIRYDADVKIRIEGFWANPQSRYGGDTPYTIWQERADLYWNEN